MSMTFYTDGSAHPNPGPGGYGIVGIEDNRVAFARSRQYDGPVTNNEMEIKAIVYTMLQFGSKDNPPIVYSDSAYCVNTFTSWMFNWAKNGWKKSDKKTPENLELIKPYYDWYQKGYRIDLRKVKGHDGIEFNEMADGLATGRLKASDVLCEG